MEVAVHELRCDRLWGGQTALDGEGRRLEWKKIRVVEAAVNKSQALILNDIEFCEW